MRARGSTIWPVRMGRDPLGTATRPRHRSATLRTPQFWRPNGVGNAFYSVLPFHYCCDVGIEVKAVPLKRSPRTATLPELTVNRAAPRLPATLDNPEMLRKAASVLVPAAKEIEDVPITTPELF